MKSRNIQADILDVLLDGKVHTYSEIAKKTEILMLEKLLVEKKAQKKQHQEEM